FIGQQHSPAGQMEAGALAPETAGLDEPLEIPAETAPDVNAITFLYGSAVDTVNQPQACEQGVSEALVRAQPPCVDRGRHAARDPVRIILGGRDILPSDPVACR